MKIARFGEPQARLVQRYFSLFFSRTVSARSTRHPQSKRTYHPSLLYAGIKASPAVEGLGRSQSSVGCQDSLKPHARGMRQNLVCSRESFVVRYSEPREIPTT